jgi:LysM repeat protein
LLPVQKLRLTCVALLMLLAARAMAQDAFSDKAKKYIDQYASLAMLEQKKNGIPAAVTLGQGILETEAGTSELMTEANNHFGIKCKNGWQGETFTHTDDAPNECFKKYKCAADSYRDHSEHLKRNPRYSPLFSLKETDYASWAVCLKKCGYATNPQYAQRLIKIIEDYNLQKYTFSAFDTSLIASTAPITPVIEAEPLMDTVQNPALFSEATAHPVVKDDTEKPAPNRQHTVKQGETLASIATAEQVDLKKLMALNLLNPNEEPVPGAVLELQTVAKQKPAVKVNPMVAHSGNAITTEDKPQGDYITIDRSKPGPAAQPARPQSAAAPHTVATATTNPTAAQVVPPKKVIIVSDSKRPVRPPDAPTDEELAKAAKDKEFTDLKAELDKVVYADDSKLIEQSAPAPEKKTATDPPAAKGVKYYTVKKGDTAFSIAKRNNITVAELKKLNNLEVGEVKVGQSLKVKE